MDIEEAKKFARNKIEADTLTQQVRDIIKKTKWQKQDMREGFKEIFQPIIESQVSIKKSIDEQQNKTLNQLQANQLALTQVLNQNRMAITQGLENLIFKDVKGNQSLDDYQSDQSLDDYQSLDGDQSDQSLDGDQSDQSLDVEEGSYLTNKELDQYLINNTSINVLKKYGYHNLPSYYNNSKFNLKYIKDLLRNISNDMKVIQDSLKDSAIFFRRGDYFLSVPKKNVLQNKILEKLNEFNILSIYNKHLYNLYLYKEKQKLGSGITLFNNPHQLLDRLKLLGVLINAGNNDEILEFSKIAQLLNKMKVISNKQLNDLLKTYITNR